MIKLRISRWKIILDYLSEPKGGSDSLVGNVTAEARGDTRKRPLREKKRGNILPWSLQREHSHADNLIVIFWTPEL